MKHRHHIKPKHAGGEDEEENLTPPIPVVRHAMFHWCEWQRTENEFDRIAWLSLTAQSSTKETLFLVLSEAGNRRATQMKERGQLFFDSAWQSKQGKKGAEKMLEIHQDSVIQRLRDAVTTQLNTGTHPFQQQNRTWDQSEASKKAARTQLELGNHPFLNPTWDRSKSAKKSAATQLERGTHSSQTADKGPNYKIVKDNAEKIVRWWLQNKSRKVSNGRKAGPKTCNEDLDLKLTSLQCLKTFLTSLNDKSYSS
jgi:hypothetical protein